MPVTRSFDPNLFDVRLTAITLGATRRPSLWKDILELKAWSTSMFKDPTAIRTEDQEGFGPQAQVYETEPFPFDVPVKGYLKVTPINKFALGCVFTEELLEDDLTGIMDQMANSLGKSSDLRKDLQAAQLYDNADNTTYYTAPDGLAIISPVHKSRGGGPTRSNTLSVSGVAVSQEMSYSAIQDLLTVGFRQTDNRGYPNPAFKLGDSLNVLFQPEDWAAFQKLLGPQAAYEYKENVFESPNVNRNMKWTPVMNQYQVDSNAVGRPWLFLNKDVGIPWLVQRTPMRTSSYLVNANKALAYDIRERDTIHVQTWEGIYGSGY